MAKSPVAPLPDDSRVARYVGYGKLRRDGETGDVVGVLPTAFVMRPIDAYLSAAHMDAFQGTDLERLSALKKAYDPHPLQVKVNGAFTVGRVEEIKATCVAYHRPVRIVGAPNDKLKCYVQVRQFRSDVLELLNALADDVWGDFTLVKHIPD